MEISVMRPCKRSVNATQFIFSRNLSIVNIKTFKNYSVIRVYLRALEHGQADRKPEVINYFQLCKKVLKNIL